MEPPGLLKSSPKPQILRLRNIARAARSDLTPCTLSRHFSRSVSSRCRRRGVTMGLADACNGFTQPSGRPSDTLGSPVGPSNGASTAPRRFTMRPQPPPGSIVKAQPTPTPPAASTEFHPNHGPRRRFLESPLIHVVSYAAAPSRRVGHEDPVAFSVTAGAAPPPSATRPRSRPPGVPYEVSSSSLGA